MSISSLKILLLILALLPCIASAQGPSADLPVVTGSWINNGESQRSMIQSIGVTFDRNVSSILDQNALKVRKISTGAMVDLSTAILRFDPSNNSASWILDYNTSALLADGDYIAWFEIDGILDEKSRYACALTTVPLDDFVFGFHQYTGDSDGDRDVDFRDSCVLRETWLQQLGNKRYLSYFDFNLSLVVDEADRARVNTTYFTTIPATPAVHLYLRNDTGEDFSDGATSLYSFGFGSVATDGMTWTASLNGGTPVDVTAQVVDGKGTLDEALIDQLNGGPLTLGNYTLRVEATDGSKVATDEMAFEYLGEVACPPYFITIPPPGVSLGSVRPAQPLNLSDWTIVTYPDAQALPNWQISNDGLTATQLLNARPSALLSPDSLLNLRVTGTFRAGTGFDDDFMGFMFGYQNSKQFYLFDWKRREQDYVGGTALRGMTLKRIDAGDRNVTIADLWWSNEDRENTKILTPPNDIPWVPGQDYQITLEFTPGRIVVEVIEEGVLLASLVAEDDTFTGGRFGFYNASQDSVVYSGFTQERLDNTYYYDSEAEDPESQPLTYSLVPALDGTPPPATAVINARNGTVLWQPTEAGVYPFSLLVTDADGLTDRQDFDVTVTPVDLPPTVVIRKTASSAFPGEEIGISAEGSDDQQLFRTRLFIDGVEVDPNTSAPTITTTRTFDRIGQVSLRAIAIDSADQVTETISYIRILDPSVPPPTNPNQTPVSPPGQGTGDTDIRPLVSFQAPLSPSDDPSTFVGTVDANGGTLGNWYLEWALASRVNYSDLNDPGVLCQVVADGTDEKNAEQLGVITPANFPNELLVFRLRAVNSNGLGRITAITFNPRSTTNTTVTGTTGTGSGVRPTVAFTAPLSPTDDSTNLRGSVGANGGTLSNWTVDYAPSNTVDLTNLTDASVAWTFLARGASPLSDALLSTLVPSSLPNAPLVFRLTAFNSNGLGSVTAVVFNPSSSYSGPTDDSGSSAATGIRPVTQISSPRSSGDDLSQLIGTVLANGGTLDRYVVDYAALGSVNTNDLSDSTVTWTELATGTTEKNNEFIVALDNPDFANGKWVIRLRAFNDNGLGSLASTLLDSGDRSVPAVEFTSPAPQDEIDYLTDVSGTINPGEGVLDYWTLDMASTDQVGLNNLNASADWVELGSGNSPLVANVLGTIDPTLLRNGSYILRLRAFNTSGRGTADGLMVFVDGETKLGNFRMVFTDLTVPIAGIPITIRRIYDSLDATHQGDFGPGWTMNLQEANITESIPDTGADLFSATPFEVGTRVYITSPSGERLGYTFGVRNRRNSFFYITYEPYLIPDPGVRETLSIAPRSFERVELAGDGTAYTLGLPFGYNPDYYILTTTDGGRFEYYQRGGLEKITDASGNTVSFSRNGITHSDGTSVSITRDSAGKITRITDPSGKSIVYDYDSNGRLRYVTDRVGGRTEFVYANLSRPNFVTEIIDPRGVSAIRSDYDSDGRLIRQTDPNGNSVMLDYDLEGMTQSSTDRLGFTTTMEFDERGNVTRLEDKLGNVSTIDYYPGSTRERFITDASGTIHSRAYDSRGNLIAETTGASVSDDPSNPTVGSTTRIAFNANDDATAITDPNGNVSNITYDPSSGSITKFVAAANDGGDTTNFSSATDGEVRTITDALGNVTTFTKIKRGQSGFDDEGIAEVQVVSLSTMEDSSSNLLRRVKKLEDSNRQIIRQIDYRTLPGGAVEEIITEFTYDAEGTVTLEKKPNGQLQEYRYDLLGQLTESLLWKSQSDFDTSDDSLARKTSYQYDNNGNIVLSTYPDGTTVSAEYDAENQRIATTDQLGRTTKMIYDAAGQQRFTIFPDSTPGDDSDNPRVETIYDALGQAVEMIDEEGNRTEVVYNELGLETQKIQHLAGGGTLVSRFSYDAAGNVTEIITPKGNSTEVVVDTRNRPVAYNFPSTAQNGATSQSVEYDSVGRRTKEIDEEGRGRQLSYDGLNRLISVVYLDSTGSPLPDSRVEYEYDEVGNRIAQIYASGNRTEFRYDSTGRRIARILPGGKTETFTYDGFGQMATHTDFSGHTSTFTYDSMGRMLSISADPSHPSLTLPHAPARIEMSYYPDGNIASSEIFNASNAVIYSETMSYDARGRLELKVTPNGTLNYTYHDNGLLASVVSDKANGVNTQYVYDSANRLVRVTDAVSGVTEYTYDSNGNLIETATPNGVKQLATYNELDRLVDLQIQDSLATIIDSYAYQTTPRGDIQTETREDGRERAFVYDEYYRLQSETVTGGPAAGNGAIQYSFDSAGNRTVRTSTLASVNNQAFTYNSDFELNGATYDDNGNTLSSPTTPSAIQGTDTYDFLNRLIRRSRTDGTIIDYVYDAGRTRVSKTVTNGGSVTTRFLVDNNNPTGYAQVLEERTGAGTLDKVFTYGVDLISQRVSGASFTQFFAYDGGGSVIGLLNDAGGVLERYTYDAFGVLVDATAGLLTNYRYRGEQFDPELGMYYLRARYAEQNVGRFWTADPFEGNLDDPMSLHRYLYAHGNPVTGSDPTGFFTVLSLQVSFQISFNTRKVQARHIEKATKILATNFLKISVAYAQQYLDFRGFGSRKLMGNRVFDLYVSDLELDPIEWMSVNMLYTQSLAFFKASLAARLISAIAGWFKNKIIKVKTKFKISIREMDALGEWLINAAFQRAIKKGTAAAKSAFNNLRIVRLISAARTIRDVLLAFKANAQKATEFATLATMASDYYRLTLSFAAVRNGQ